MNPTETVAGLLIDATLAGFTFHTGFSLRFETRGEPVSVDLDGAWSFGSPDEWSAFVAAIPLSGVEPDEPAQAAYLAHLRWSEDNRVRDARVENGNLVIEFASGDRLTTAVASQANEWGVHSADGRSVVHEGGLVDASNQPDPDED